MAYPTSPRTVPRPQGVRLDFRWVVHLRFTGFWGPDPADATALDEVDRIFALNVLDESPLVSQFLGGYSDTEWPFNYRPEEVIRHFHVAFDDFGGYDVLAIDCKARMFPWSASEQLPCEPGVPLAQRSKEQAKEESSVLAGAMALDPLPPIVNDPFPEGREQETG